MLRVIANWESFIDEHLVQHKRARCSKTDTFIEASKDLSDIYTKGAPAITARARNRAQDGSVVRIS